MRKKDIAFLALFGGLMMIIAVLPPSRNPVQGQDNQFLTLPHAADVAGYNYTIGTTGIPGSDNSHFNYPIALAINDSGAVYVADENNNRVQVFDNAGNYLYTILSGFSFPFGLGINSTGYVYVADYSNHQVKVFDNAGHYLYAIGTGVPGNGNDQLYRPTDVAVNSTGYVYIVDSQNARVQVFSPNASFVYRLGLGILGSGTYQFNIPTGIAINSSDYVFVVDRNNDRVQVFNPSGTYQYTIGVTGQLGSDNAHFISPEKIAIGGANHLFVTDTGNNRTQVFNNLGVYLFTVGNGGGAANDQFFYPYGVAVNSSGQLYVADMDNQRVQVFDWPTPYGLSISIAGGAIDTKFLGVALTLSAINATEMCFSNDGVTYSAWEPYATTKSWTLVGSPGPKTVYFRARCLLNEAATPALDSINYTLPPTGLSIVINAGAPETGSLDVTLTLGATGATEMCFSNNGSTYSTWEPYATTTPWTLDSGLGSKTVYFKARNSTIEAAAPVSDTITFLLPPSGLSITINGGAPDTSNTSVTLALSAIGATQMCFSNNGITYSSWETYAVTKAWTLQGGPGLKIVFFNARNSTIEAAAPVTDNINYTLPPTGLSILINNGDPNTLNPSVTLTLAATGATEMCFSNNGTTYTNWEPFAVTKTWVLDDINGVRTVYFKARNGTIEASSPATDTINLLPNPFNHQISINGGTAETGSLTVSLDLSANYATEMCFSNNGSTYTDWEPFASTKEWTLQGGPGLLKVYFLVKNTTDESTAPATDSILYILPPSGLSIQINKGALETTDISVTLTLTATGATEMCFSNDGMTWSAWEPYGTTKQWTLPNTLGAKTIYFKTRNSTIESSNIASATINVVQATNQADPLPWIITGIVGGGALVSIAGIWQFRKKRRNVQGL